MSPVARGRRSEPAAYQALAATRGAVERALVKATRLAPTLSRPLFGTDAGLPAVAKGYLALRRNRRDSSVEVSVTHRDLVATFDTEGILRLGTPFQASLIDCIASAFDEHAARDERCSLRYETSPDIHDEEGATPVNRGRVVQRTLMKPLSLIPEIAELLTEEVLQPIEACYRSHLRLASVTYWRNYHLPSAVSEEREVGYSHYWHNDEQPIDCVKLFVAMSDVGDQDGPMHVIPKRATRRLMKWRFNRKKIRHLESFNRDSFRILGPRGSTVLCNTTLCLHRAGIPASGRQRDMLQFLFRSHHIRKLHPADLPVSPDLT